MENPSSVDLKIVAQNLKLPIEQVESAVQLLDEGNTIPFITRYRKDETKGLTERPLRNISDEVTRLRNLAERKTIILKSIDNQGQLTDKLRREIESTYQSRRLEDLYLPFKPKKQSLATTARQQGLEPLALDILENQTSDVDLATRATDFVRVDKGLNSIDEVIEGVKHLLSERFGERIQLRKELRKIYWSSAVIKTCSSTKSEQTGHSAAATEQAVSEPSKKTTDASDTSAPKAAVGETASDLHPDNKDNAQSDPAAEHSDDDDSTSPDEPDTRAHIESADSAESQSPDETTEKSGPESVAKTDTAAATGDESTVSNLSALPEETASNPASPAAKTQTVSSMSKSKTKKKKTKKKRDVFDEFSEFEEAIKKIPPHRILAINRGERAGKIKCRVSVDENQIREVARKSLIPENHPFADFLWEAAENALSKSIMPSIEREIRRELTEKSESHAVKVFSRNLRHLLLQPPVRNERILAIDPGFRTGCKAACIDEMGNPLGHTVFSIVGNQERKDKGKTALVELIKQHRPTLIAIGNGNGCRATEQLVSEIIGNELSELSLKYTIVNQAGTSAYSTSEIGREELPGYEPVIRSAISIGRRLLDPLSELVKINPANIGIGMYQHDVKSKHLHDSLNCEVESCVNFVGVNVNTASNSLLKYVSGLGQLTARNLIEYREQNGRFRSREQLKDVPRLGEITFIQSAGFLRIADSENWLDRTSIHPESYSLAHKIAERIGGTIEEFFLPHTKEPRQDAVDSPAPTEDAKPNSEVSSGGPVQSLEATSDQPEEPPIDEPASGNVTDDTDDPTTKPDAVPDRSKASGTLTVSPAILEEKRKRRSELLNNLKSLDVGQLARELKVGELKIRDILRALRFPQQDPREDLPAPIFRKEILRIEDLKPGMQLRGQIVNVVDFGVFVDIGVGESCLVHISRLSNRYVRDPYWYYGVGDILNLWVQEIDLSKRRVTLTAIRPESAQPAQRHQAKRRGRGDRRPQRHAAKRSAKSANHKSQAKRVRRRPAKPKPVTPITEAMVTGKEPMRSFSDLLQYHEKKSSEENESK